MNKHAPTPLAPPGMQIMRSAYTVTTTIDRLVAMVEHRGLRVYARIDHARIADGCGLRMPPTQLLLFGNPLASSVTMLEQPTLAIDLPMKVLAWRHEDGHTRVGYLDLDWLAQRHALPEAQRDIIQAVNQSLRTLVYAAISREVALRFCPEPEPQARPRRLNAVG